MVCVCFEKPLVPIGEVRSLSCLGGEGCALRFASKKEKTLFPIQREKEGVVLYKKEEGGEGGISYPPSFLPLFRKQPPCS